MRGWCSNLGTAEAFLSPCTTVTSPGNVLTPSQQHASSGTTGVRLACPILQRKEIEAQRVDFSLSPMENSTNYNKKLSFLTVSLLSSMLH